MTAINEEPPVFDGEPKKNSIRSEEAQGFILRSPQTPSEVRAYIASKDGKNTDGLYNKYSQQEGGELIEAFKWLKKKLGGRK